MIGLLFFVVIAIWAVVAFALGSKIPLWLGLKQHRVALGSAFALMLFVAPVADEILAYPQMKALCRTIDHLEYDPKTATGQTVSKYSSVIGNEIRTLFPGIQVRIERRALVTPYVELPIVKWTSIEPQAGFLHFPAGSSGGSMPLLLSDCGFTARSSEQFFKAVEPLKLVRTEYQPTK